MLFRGLTIFIVLLSIAIYAARKWRDRNGNDGPVVELPFGRLSGSKLASRLAGRDILAFRGIPYARKVVTYVCCGLRELAPAASNRNRGT